LIDIAMLLDQALDLLSPRRGRYTAGLDKADAAFNELDRRILEKRSLTLRMTETSPERMMTVVELISLLQTHDADLRVVVAGYENGFNDVVGFEPVTLGPNINREWWSGEFGTLEAGEPALFIRGMPREAPEISESIEARLETETPGETSRRILKKDQLP
jgi:hypothetical protein